MKKPVVDYRNLRPGNITSPEYSHLLYLGGWIVYFALYFITENLIPFEKCHVIHCRLDDIIPFNEYFLLFYCFWYLLIVFSLLYFALYDPKSFKSLQSFIMITQAIAVITYIAYPSIQNLRPASFDRDNIFTHLMAFIYKFDTPSGVCPSLHVAYSLGIMSTWLKRKNSTLYTKFFMVIITALISISTTFVKQHSFVDVIAALPVGLAAEIIVFKDFWLARYHLRQAGI